MNNNFNIANWRKRYLLNENQNINRSIIKNTTLEQGQENGDGKTEDEIQNRVRRDLSEFYDLFEMTYTEEEYDTLVEKYINDIDSYDEFVEYDTDKMKSEELLSDFEMYVTNMNSNEGQKYY